MNEPSDVPQLPEAVPPLIRSEPNQVGPKKSFTCVNRFLACNPFYLVSAALLLYGFYRVSIDTNFLRGELPQLLFDFSSLQLYELLVVITAIFLAHRLIWYDSTLLMSLENLLLLVPFILISQAGLIDPRLVWAFSLIAGLVAVGRFGALKRFITPLNFPRRMGFIGLAVLVVNVGLPIIYRTLHQYKWGTKPDWGAAYYTNELCWLVVLPAVCALAMFLPAKRNTGELLPQRGWLSSGWFSLWLLGTGLHLYCLGYVYDFSLRRELVVPSLWVLAWVLPYRGAVWVEKHFPQLKPAILAVPPLVAFFAVSEPWNRTFLVLVGLNVLIYARRLFLDRQDRIALHLLFLSVLAFVAWLPETWGRLLLADFNRISSVGAGAAGYVLIVTAVSHNPKHGILGALVLVGSLLGLLGGRPESMHGALHAGLAFLLLHSMRWIDYNHEGARGARVLAAALWVGHAVLWMHTGPLAWMSCSGAALALAIYLIFRLLSGRWAPRLIPLAAFLVMLAAPGDFTAEKASSAPAGVLAIAGSFLLFGLGTLVALSRHRWSR